MITFVEHLFSLSPLTAADRNSYDYAGSFDFAQTPAMSRLRPTVVTISPSEKRELNAYPWVKDNDPT
jgi:hypothetical protein